jgi:predicted nucleic acid-binding protein
MLVVDATVAVAASHTRLGFASLTPNRLTAPPLMLVETSSVLHEMAWRGEVSAAHAATMLQRVLRAPIEIRAPTELTVTAWGLADELGWAKTYDAQYVALARLLGCKLVTLDERLIRGVARLAIALRPREL